MACSLAVSGFRVSSLMSCAVCVRHANASCPFGVTETIVRRRSVLSFSVCTNSRFFNRSTTPLIVAASIAVSRPKAFCDNAPASVSFASVANCIGVRLPIART